MSWFFFFLKEFFRRNPNLILLSLSFSPFSFFKPKTKGAGGRLKKPDYDKVATACFVQPPLASCGLTEEEAAARVEAAAKAKDNGDGGKTSTFAPSFDIFVSKFRPMRNTLSGRNESTLMKMIVDSDTDEVVGCHMVSLEKFSVFREKNIFEVGFFSRSRSIFFFLSNSISRPFPPLQNTTGRARRPGDHARDRRRDAVPRAQGRLRRYSRDPPLGRRGVCDDEDEDEEGLRERKSRSGSRQGQRAGSSW